MDTPGKRHDFLTMLLAKKHYTRLLIRRYNDGCVLVIFTEDEGHLYTNKKGEKITYRHARQLKAWLESQFDIPNSAIEFEDNSKD